MKFLHFVVSALAFCSLAVDPIAASSLSTSSRQNGRTCSSDIDCNTGLIFPMLRCKDNLCRDPSENTIDQSVAAKFSDEAAFTARPSKAEVGGECTSIRECELGLVCVSGNPRGKCATADGIIGLSHLLVNIIQEDYTPGNEDDPSSSPFQDVTPDVPGPTATSHALAIIYLAAHDAYALITGAFTPKIRTNRLRTRFNRRSRSFSRMAPSILEEQAVFAMQAAGLTAARLLYPSQKRRIDAVRQKVTSGAFPRFTQLGDVVGKSWVLLRKNDGSKRNQLDDQFVNMTLRHQPDPNFPIVTNMSDGVQRNFGRTWGRLRPFVLSNVKSQASLKPFPTIDSAEYRENLNEVTVKGQCNSLTSNGVPLSDIGEFWGYDSARKIGVPPRLYLQVVLAVEELGQLPIESQLRALTGVAVSMADAGIAAWFWKFKYDLWRPVIGVRADPQSPVPGWNPVGVSLVNIAPLGSNENTAPKCVGLSPDFPAYPSGHASFGSAAFRTLAKLLSKAPGEIRVKFTSDEFNGRTIDGVTATTRKVFTQTITLQEAIQQNMDARVYLGVHWRFDSEGGDVIGTKVADAVADAFSLN